MEYSVTFENFIAQLNLEVLSVPDDTQKIKITSTEVNRPGLLISGFSKDFDPSRIQILGRMEFSYLDSLDHDVKIERMNNLFGREIPAVIVTRNMLISSEIVELARRHKVPLLRTGEETSTFMAEAIAYLNNELAKRITRHGVLVEVYGEGDFDYRRQRRRQKRNGYRTCKAWTQTYCGRCNRNKKNFQQRALLDSHLKIFNTLWNSVAWVL